MSTSVGTHLQLLRGGAEVHTTGLEQERPRKGTTSSRYSMGFFLLVGFGLPWLGWTTYAIIGKSLSPGAAQALFYTGDFMAVAGLVATYVAAGSRGVRHLARRLLPGRLPLLWVFFALLLPLLWRAIPIVVYASSHGGIGPIEWSGFAKYLSMPALIAFTTGPIGEEAGWRGYLLPRLLSRFSPLTASVILGAVWSIWHYPLYYNTIFAAPDRAAQFTIATISYSVLMTVLWAFSRGSVLWAMVFHWSVNVTSSVVAAVIPSVRPAQGATAWPVAIVLAVVAVSTAVLVGPERLARRLAEVRGGLSDECV
jgi:membrane protease YdiL (CAAX protease family)